MGFCKKTHDLEGLEVAPHFFRSCRFEGVWGFTQGSHKRILSSRYGLLYYSRVCRGYIGIMEENMETIVL